MYVIDEKWRRKMYEGSLTYMIRIYYPTNNSYIELPYWNIKSLKVGSPALDKESKSFYLGNFISQRLEFETDDHGILYRYLIGQTLYMEVKMLEYDTAGEFVDDVTVPIGYFVVETQETDISNMKTKIVALDNAVKFKDNFEPMATVVGGGITALDLLQQLCTYYGVELASYPNTNTNATTAYIDNTKSGKLLVSYIAEIMGGNARINRNGQLEIVPAVSAPVATINPLACEEFEITVQEPYEFANIQYDNGLIEHHAPSIMYDMGNTLNVRQDNIFITGTQEERQAVIDNMYASLGSQFFRIFSLKAKNYIDITLDPYDVVSYTPDENEEPKFNTYYSNEWELNGGTPMGINEIKIPTTQQEKTTNTIPPTESIMREIRSISTTVDQQEATLTSIATRTSYLENAGFTTTNEVEDKLSAYSKTVTVREWLTDGSVTKVDAEGFIFDTNGLTIERKDGEGNYIGDTHSRLNENGLSVVDNNTNETTLFAGYDANEKETVVITQNTIVRNFLRLDNVGRWQNYRYTDGTNRANIDNTLRTGFFWTYYEGDDE